MVFHLREAKRWRLRLGDESTNLDDQIESLRVSGATDAEVAADPTVAATGRLMVEAYTRLVPAIGSLATNDVLQAEGEALVELDPHDRNAVVDVVREAGALEGWRLHYADNRPAVPPAQGWLRVRRVVRRVLLFFFCTSLMDVAAALGCPPFQGLLLFTLFCCHWLVVTCIALASQHRLAANSWPAIWLVVGVVLAGFQFTWDTAARAKAVKGLERVSAEAAAVVARLPAPEQLPSLHAALAAWADCCASTLQHDKLRLKYVCTNWLSGLRLT